MKQMIYLAFLFLILTNISFAGLATNPYLNGGTLQESYSWTNPPSWLQTSNIVLTPYTITYNNLSNADNVKCWVRFVYNSSVANNSKTSRWVMAGHNDNGVVDITDITTTLISSTSKLTSYNYYFTTYIADINSSPNFNSLCTNGENLLVYLYGGASDDFGVSNDIYGYPTQISNLKYTALNNYYMCLNTTSEESNFSMVDVTNPIKAKSTYINFEVACGRELSPNQWTRFVKNQGYLGLPNYYLFPYIIPQPYILNGLDNTTIQLIYDMPTLPQDLGSQITRGIGSIVMGIISYLVDGSTAFVGMLPEPVPSIIKMISIVVDFLFVLIILFVMYKVAVAFLSFRKSLKSSLTKATIIFMQLIIFLFIAISMYYLLSQTFTYCATKSGLTIFGMRQLGIEIKIPQSITDIPALLWDTLYIGVVNSAVPECQQYYASLTDSSKHVSTTMPLFCDISIPPDLNKPCQSLMIRSVTAVLILFILTIVLGIIWTLAMHIFTRVKSLETKVRGPDYEYEEEEIE
jgi:hypothetical protein